MPIDISFVEFIWVKNLWKERKEIGSFWFILGHAGARLKKICRTPRAHSNTKSFFESLKIWQKKFSILLESNSPNVFTIFLFFTLVVKVLVSGAHEGRAGVRPNSWHMSASGSACKIWLGDGHMNNHINIQSQDNSCKVENRPWSWEVVWFLNI